MVVAANDNSCQFAIVTTAAPQSTPVFPCCNNLRLVQQRALTEVEQTCKPPGLYHETRRDCVAQLCRSAGERILALRSSFHLQVPSVRGFDVELYLQHNCIRQTKFRIILITSGFIPTSQTGSSPRRNWINYRASNIP